VNIDANTIMKNKINQSISQALFMDIIRAILMQLRPGGKWDLKSNEKTIFGIAWEYDDKT
jgi:hypothetical protein